MDLADASDHRLIAATTGKIVCPNSVSWSSTLTGRVAGVDRLEHVTGAHQRLAAGGLRGRLVLKPAAVAA